MGTEGGTLHVLRVEEKEKRERTWAPLLHLDGTDANPVRGCHQQVGIRRQPRNICAALVRLPVHEAQATLLAAHGRGFRLACAILFP